MALSPDVQAAIERAKARVAETTIRLDRTYFDEAFSFHFLPTLNQPALEIVSRVQGMSKQAEPDVVKQLEALLDFMDVMATDETAETIATLGRAGIMQIDDLVELQMDVVEQVTSRPTTRSSSSADGSSTSGESSTASAPTEASTRPPSPSTVS